MTLILLTPFRLKCSFFHWSTRCSLDHYLDHHQGLHTLSHAAHVLLSIKQIWDKINTKNILKCHADYWICKGTQKYKRDTRYIFMIQSTSLTFTKTVSGSCCHAETEIIPPWQKDQPDRMFKTLLSLIVSDLSDLDMPVSSVSPSSVV